MAGSYAAACCSLTTGFCCYEGAKIRNTLTNFQTAFLILCKRRIGVVTFGGYFNHKRQRRKRYRPCIQILSKFSLEILPPFEKILIYTIYVFWGAFFASLRLTSSHLMTYCPYFLVSFSFLLYVIIKKIHTLMVKLRVSVKELAIIVRDFKSIASLGFCFIWDSF